MDMDSHGTFPAKVRRIAGGQSEFAILYRNNRPLMKLRPMTMDDNQDFVFSMTAIQRDLSRIFDVAEGVSRKYQFPMNVSYKGRPVAVLERYKKPFFQ